jgi:hypothetical protein
MDGETDYLTLENISALRTGGDTAVQEARKVVSSVLTRAPRESVEQVRTAIDEITQAGGKALQDPRAAQLLGRLTTLVHRLAVANASDELCWQAVAATKALKTDGGAAFAETVVSRIEYQLSASAPIYIVLRGMLTSVGIVVATAAVVFILFVLSIFASLPPGTSFFTVLWNAWLSTQQNTVVVAGMFGLLGAIVSILLSIAQFDLVRRSDQFLLMSGAVLPIVGAILATVACAFFLSGLVSTTAITEHEDKAIFFFIVLGFVAGFSERFVRGLLLVFEERYADGADNQAQRKNGDNQPLGPPQ